MDNWIYRLICHRSRKVAAVYQSLDEFYICYSERDTKFYTRNRRFWVSWCCPLYMQQYFQDFVFCVLLCK